jgi:basic amino acid/polyamine antiporter, APA family
MKSSEAGNQEKLE